MQEYISNYKQRSAAMSVLRRGGALAADPLVVMFVERASLYSAALIPSVLVLGLSVCPSPGGSPW